MLIKKGKTQIRIIYEPCKECKVNSEEESKCKECGRCGRRFDKNGRMIDIGYTHNR